jgi:hypothetical protein
MFMALPLLRSWNERNNEEHDVSIGDGDLHSGVANDAEWIRHLLPRPARCDLARVVREVTVHREKDVVQAVTRRGWSVTGCQPIRVPWSMLLRERS